MTVNRQDRTLAETATTNVRVFDGRSATDETGARVIDGPEAVLPGLIDAHTHLRGVENLHDPVAAQ